jgi:DNA-binding NarL/FixJ family response regulator
MEEMRNAFFDVVITERGAPGTNGVTLAQWIAQDHPETRLVELTGHVSAESTADAQCLGTLICATKSSTDSASLAVAIRHALQASHNTKSSMPMMNATQLHSACLCSVIDRFPLGVILANASMVVAHVNRIGKEILAERDGLMMERDHRLYGWKREVTIELRALVGRTAGGLQGDGAGGGLSLARPSGRHPLSLLVAPIPMAGSPETGAPCAAVFVSDPERRAATTHDLLRRLYGLTRAEAILASAMMQGKSVERSCLELGISTNTARTHLKRIFCKTDTSRQGELISLLLSSPAMMSAEPS